MYTLYYYKLSANARDENTGLLKTNYALHNETFVYAEYYKYYKHFIKYIHRTAPW